jgi:hypothetical protein
VRERGFLLLLAFLTGILSGCGGDSEPSRVVPDEVQAQLPLTLSLGNLCPARKLRPNSLVSFAVVPV